jgi:DNA-directed RNA polymerase I subunit RPA12
MEVWSPDAPFCPRCGTLLVLPDYGSVQCDKCPFAVPLADMPKAKVVTTSYPKPLPEWFVAHAAEAAAKRGELATGHTGPAKRAVVNEECPKCKNPTMEYYTMQLRSADEGQTVFYECKKCGHKFSVNT